VIITAGMLAGGLPFLLILRAMQGRFGLLFNDSQVHWYMAILLMATAAVSAWLYWHQRVDILEALRYGSFNVVSIMTGTGYASADYLTWGVFPASVIFFLTFVGGCAGSTACGIKVFRFQVLYAATKSHISRLVYPDGVFIAYFNHRPLSEKVINSVLSFFFIFGTVFALLSLSLTGMGLDFETAVTSAATALSNVGPGLGPIVGPSGNFQSLPDGAKWLLSVGMLVGRLEVFTVIVLFSREFWRG